MKINRDSNGRLLKGSKLAPGGSRPNSGRPADWLKLKCQKLIERRKIIEFLSDVADGKSVSFSVTISGAVVPCPASTKDRIHASEILLDRAFGKVVQPLEHSVNESLEALLAGSRPT